MCERLHLAGALRPKPETLGFAGFGTIEARGFYPLLFEPTIFMIAASKKVPFAVTT